MPWGIAGWAAAVQAAATKTALETAEWNANRGQEPTSTARFLDLDEAAAIQEPVIIGRAIDLE